MEWTNPGFGGDATAALNSRFSTRRGNGETYTMSDQVNDQAPQDQPAQADTETPKPETFTQADVDKIVRERVARERAKFGDYDDLKRAAAEAKTVEDRLAELESENAKIRRTAMAARIAAEHGISASDADLFLTGTDEDTLRAQAERLSARNVESKREGLRVPAEGNTPKPVEDAASVMARGFFGSARN